MNDIHFCKSEIILWKIFFLNIAFLTFQVQLTSKYMKQ